MKAGLLSGFYALQALFALGMAHFEEIAFFFSSEEEVGSPVSRTWLTQLAPHYDAGLVLEAGRPDGSVVVARKGGGFLRVCVEGREAHTGIEPEKGASAILELAHHIIALQGGTARNVVPGAAEAGADVRVVDEEGREAIETLTPGRRNRPPTLAPQRRHTSALHTGTPNRARTGVRDWRGDQRRLVRW